MGFLSISLLPAIVLSAVQDSAKPADSLNFWRKGGEAGINSAFSGTSPNWSGGSSNNIAINTYFNAFANRTWDHSSWDNTLKISLGAISSKLKDNLGNDFRSTKKNMDNLFFMRQSERAVCVCLCLCTETRLPIKKDNTHTQSFGSYQ